MEDWRNRHLESHYTAFYIDGLHVKLKRDGVYQNECFYIILGLKENQTREVIAIVNFQSESSLGWTQIFGSLIERGVNSVGIIVSDGLKGLDTAIAKSWIGIAHHKCIVHLKRNLQELVRRDDKKELAQDVRNLLSPDDVNYTIEMAYQSVIDLARK